MRIAVSEQIVGLTAGLDGKTVRLYIERCLELTGGGC
jgi:hypothetical protein